MVAIMSASNRKVTNDVVTNWAVINPREGFEDDLNTRD